MQRRMKESPVQHRVRKGGFAGPVAVAIAAALALSACSSSKSTQSASTPTAGGGSPAAPTSAGASTGSGGSAAPGGGLSVTLDQACQAGGSEGTLNYWTSTDPDVFKQEIPPFEAKYPNIKINYTSLRPADMVQRIIAEVQANHALDVDAIAGDLPSFAPLFDEKLIQPVDWTKLGVASDVQFELKGFTTVRTYREVLGLGYNTQLVKESDLPSTWQELINSKWAGKVIADPRGVYLSGLSLAMGKDKAIEWFKSFMSTDKPQIVKGATASMQKVISGEALLTTSSHDAEATEQQQKGAPVGIKYLDIVPTQDWYAIVMKGAAHPNAAACFFGWWTGSEGQAQQLKYEFKENKTTPDGLPAGAKLVAINDPDEAQTATDTATEFAKLMGQ
jgi:iron(III) transport system substrate-binding protein